jgi:hypothetical protein
MHKSFIRTSGLALSIFALTTLFVVLGYTLGDKLKVVYMRQGASTMGHNAPAGTPAAAVQKFYEEVQRRDFNAAYNYVANKQEVDRDTFQRDIKGSGGDLRSLAALSDFDTQQLATDSATAKIRANLQWATAVGAFYETRDLKVVKGKSGWQVEWVPAKDVAVPPQVVAVNYPRWDLIRPDSAGNLANEQLGKPKVRIIAQQAASDADNYIVFGEIVNDDSQPAFVDVDAILVDASGKTLAQENSFDAISHTLLPGEKTPFRIDFSGVNRELVNNVKLTLNSSVVPASGDPIVSVTNPHLEAAGTQKLLKGELLNQSGDAINIPQVLAAFYDASGKIVWVNNTYLNRAAQPQTPLVFAMQLPERVAANVNSFSVRVNSYKLD